MAITLDSLIEAFKDALRQKKRPQRFYLNAADTMDVGKFEPRLYEWLANYAEMKDPRLSPFAFGVPATPCAMGGEYTYLECTDGTRIPIAGAEGKIGQ